MTVNLAQAFTRDNLLRAFQRVESAGVMPGVDGIPLHAFRRQLDLNLERLESDLLGGTYSSSPLLRIVVAEADGSPAARYIPTVRDRTAQGAVISLVAPMLESYQEHAFPPHLLSRCMRQAARRAGQLSSLGFHFVVDGQIDRFFMAIDHGVVTERCSGLLGDPAAVRLVEGWVRAEVVDDDRIGLLERGIPLGSVIAQFLAGLLLGDLDDALDTQGVEVVRYGDDLVVFAKAPLPGRRHLEITAEVLAGLQLTLDPEDSQMADFWQGLEFWRLLFPGDWTLAPWDRRGRPRKILHIPSAPAQ